MKLSLAVSTPEVISTKIGIPGNNFIEILGKISEAGYNGIELMPLNPKKINIKRLKDMIDSMGLEVPAVGTGLVYGITGFTLMDDLLKNKALDLFKSIVEFTAHFKSLITIGSIRGWLLEDSYGRIDAYSREKGLKILRFCSDYAERYNVKIGLEPLNRYESNFINNTKEALEIINELKAENIGLVLDTYHMNIEEPTYEGALNIAKDKLLHIHLGDNNRFPPGYGHIDFSQIIKGLKIIEYNGYLSGEMIPWPDVDSAIKEISKKIKPMIR